MRSTAMILSCALLLGADVPRVHQQVCHCVRAGGKLEQKWRTARRHLKETWIRIGALAAGEEVVL